MLCLIITYYLTFEQSVCQGAKRRKIVIRKINCIYRKILRIFFWILKIKI